MNNNKFLLISVLLLIVGLFLSITLYEKVNPLAAVNISSDKEEINKHLEEFFNQNEIFLPEGTFNYNFRTNEKLLDSLHKKIGIEATNELTSNTLPSFYWRINYLPFGAENDTRDIVFYLNTEGEIISFSQKLPDTIRDKNLTVDEIKLLSDSLIVNNTIYKSATFNKIQINNSDFYNAQDGKYWKNIAENDEIEIEYLMKSEYLDKDILVTVFFKKGNLEQIKSDIPIGNLVQINSNLLYFNIIIKLFIGICVLIISVVALFKRIRSGEIGFKLATFISLIAFLSCMITFYGSNGNNTLILKIINSIFSSIIISGFLLIVWTITEVLIREKWADKLSGFDLIINKQITHSIVGKNILMGISCGVLFTGIEYLMIYGFINIYNFSLTSFTNGVNYFSSDFPLMRLSTSSLLISFGYIIPFVGLVPSLLAKKINSNILIVIISALIFGVFRFNPDMDFLNNTFLHLIISGLFVFLFLKTDFLTVIITLFTNLIFNNIIVFYGNDDIQFLNIGLLFGYLILFFLIYSIVIMFSKDKIKNPVIFAPHYARDISEKERLIEEINSARDVQNSFLPKDMPKFDGLDIAASCKPAIEVGGDYYDFHELSQNELSFIIGDVSGKGTKAAFIMTIIKGFIKALFTVHISPKDLLIKLNHLFIDNVPKGNFVTVLLGKINIKKKTLTFCSAGHNPMILRKKNGDLIELNPDGMAIGLTKNSLFESNLKETTINYESGDMLVTYTDGFTEAKNRKKEEFGVDKFKHIVKIFSGVSSEELLNLLIKHTNRFRGYAKQHDDMTIIIINFDH